MPTAREVRYRAKIDKFTALYMNQTSQLDSWRAVTPRYRRHNQEQQEKLASAFANRPEVKARLQDVLKQARISDLDSPGQHMSRMLERSAKAAEAEHWTGASAYDRIIANVHGMVREGANVNVLIETSDDQLIARLAQRNPELAELIKAALVPSGFGTLPAALPVNGNGAGNDSQVIDIVGQSDGQETD